MTVEENPVLQLESDCQILQYVDEEVFQDSAHIARLTNEETLDTYVFLNEDGSKTVYYMDEPVRFIDANGTVKEKDLTLTAVGDGYTTTQNDIQLTIPTDPADGIHLIYDNHYISLIPQGGTLSAAVQITDSSVTYPDYYGEGMSLRYSPTLSGVKEDILLNAYTGINSFIFRLNTGGLNLYQAKGRYFLAKSKMSTDRIELGNVVTYDARGRFSVGTMTAQTIMAGQAYLLTLTVEEDFLTDENTTYPVTIDPTLTVSDNSHGAGAIEDATVYEGQPSLNTGTWPYNHVGYYDDTYGMGHTVVRLKGLLEDSTYAAVDADKILSAEFHIKEASGNTDGRIYLYPMYSNTTWTESGITWNNKGSYIGSAYDSVVLGNGETASFDITNLIKDWKNGVRNANAGFILDASSSNTAVKAIYASEHSTTGNRPYVTVTYAGRITLSGPLDVDEGETITLTAVTEPAGEAVTWESSDSSVATVSGGVVTGLKAGKVSITATLSDGKYASRTIYVTIPDGVYRISQGSLYLGTSGSIADHTEAHLIAKSEDGLAQLSQLWKIKYITNGYYTIRPMHKLNMALDSTSGTVDIVSDGGNDALLGGSFSNRWGIDYYDGGYVLKSANIDSNAMRCTAVYPGADVLTDTYSATNSVFHWTMTYIGFTVVNLDIIYDYAYLNRYSDAPDRLSSQITALQEKYFSEFGVRVNCSLPTIFASYADSECSTNADQVCNHVNDEQCTNSRILPDGSISLQSFHHNNIFNIMLRIPFPDLSRTFRMAYIGHNTCCIIGKHYSSPYYGLTYSSIGLMTITNTASEASETKTMVHEFGHLFDAPDHYGGSQPSTRDMNAETGDTSFNENCIYGEHKDDQEVMENLTICEGCKARIRAKLKEGA